MTFSFPTVALTTQGFSHTVNTGEFHPDTLTAILVYGTRRWFQDAINSQAKEARDAGEPFDAKDAFDARLEQALSGKVSARRSVGTADPLDPYRVAVLRGIMKTPKGKDLRTAYDAIPSDDQKARVAFLLEVAAKNAAVIDPRAAAMKAEEEKRAADLDTGLAVSF